ncbi:MAG: hypothetical protein EXS60_01015 [Candidatus Pacebacteria bacterium]|nr:hypothetical protein [Candidatus Paceibacterota bacterium]
MQFARFDALIVHRIKRIAEPCARGTLFIIFFWFGLLKVLDISSVDPLVAALLENILPSVLFESFRVFFGTYEMVIGLAFLVRGADRLAVALLLPHMFATFLPLIILPNETWVSVLVPTFVGQYIIKNLVIIALALSVAAHLHPIKK